MNNAIITTVEAVNLNALAESAASEKEAIKDLDFLLCMFWEVRVCDFEAAIRMMETCLKFDCIEAADKIKRDLRKSNPYTWAAYVNSHKSDNSAATDQDNR